jgi:hypothetical protein
MKTAMNSLYVTSNWSMAILIVGGSLAGFYGCFNVFGVAGTAFLTAMLAVIAISWVLL